MDLCAFHVVCADVSFSECFVFYGFLHVNFLNTAFSLRMRFELPFYGTFANYLRWVVLFVFTPFMALRFTLVVFYVKGNNYCIHRPSAVEWPQK